MIVVHACAESIICTHWYYDGASMVQILQYKKSFKGGRKDLIKPLNLYHHWRRLDYIHASINPQDVACRTQKEYYTKRILWPNKPSRQMNVSVLTILVHRKIWKGQSEMGHFGDSAQGYTNSSSRVTRWYFIVDFAIYI